MKEVHIFYDPKDNKLHEGECAIGLSHLLISLAELVYPEHVYLGEL